MVNYIFLKSYRISVLCRFKKQRADRCGLLKEASGLLGAGLLAQPPCPFCRLQPCLEGHQRVFSTRRRPWACSDLQADAVGCILQPGIRVALERALRSGEEETFALGLGLSVPCCNDTHGGRKSMRPPVLSADRHHTRLRYRRPVGSQV